MLGTHLTRLYRGGTKRGHSWDRNRVCWSLFIPHAGEGLWLSSEMQRQVREKHSQEAFTRKLGKVFPGGVEKPTVGQVGASVEDAGGR